MIRAQLDLLVRDEVFRSSKRSVAFLKYVVEQTLNGSADQIKERTIGVEVFGARSLVRHEPRSHRSHGSYGAPQKTRNLLCRREAPLRTADGPYSRLVHPAVRASRAVRHDGIGTGTEKTAEAPI